MKKILTFLILNGYLIFTTSLFAQFSGGTYTIGTNGSEDYSTLFAACTALNAAGSLDGDVIFEITTDLTEATNVPLGVNTNGHTLTFRPSEDVDKTISFTKTSANNIDVGSAPLGAFVIGTTALTNYNNLVPTSNVVINGLPSGGSTSRLIIRKSGASNSARNYPISIVGNSENVTISNLTIDFTEGSSIIDYHFAIALITYKDGSGNQYAPDYFTLDNCSINATFFYSTWGVGAILGGFNAYSYSGDFPDHLVIKNSIFTCQGGGIYLSDFANAEIFNNTFSISSSSSSANIYGIKVESRLDYADISIYSNVFKLFSSMGNTNRNENVIKIIGNYGTGGNSTIYNNMIYGIEKPIVSGSGNNLNLINVSSNSASIVYNTLYMTNLSSNTYMAAFAPYRGINLSSSMTFNLANNIIFIDEDDFQSVGIYYENTNSEPGIDASDYNNIYRSGILNSKTGYADTEGGFCSSLTDWQTNSSFGTHSVSKAVTFVSSTDLHLAGSSLGDLDLIGTPIGGITTDIDGETRNATFPYMGADENLANPLPVELTSFSASVEGAKVNLNWQTATEVNNYGFEIERSSVGTTHELSLQWEKIGFVEGHGNSNSPKQYTYRDDKASEVLGNLGGLDGKLQYRLKQIDFDGKFEYTSVVEVGVNNLPTEFSLSQNYPNPFNPNTSIEYSVPSNEYVSLKVYDILGNEIVTLVNEQKEAGNYEVNFDASNFVSGVYIYRLTLGNKYLSKKMILIK